MTDTNTCSECGAEWQSSKTCTDYFHTIGFWELDHQLWDKHHLMVLCYHLQHPNLYSPVALRGAQQQLVDFVESGMSLHQMRQKISKAVDSGRRKFKIKGTSDSHGQYQHPIQWTMTCADVVTAGIENYYQSVDRWAQSVLDCLRKSGNLEARP